MKTSSAKAKGRRLQQYVRDMVQQVFGLSGDDVRSTSMGASGEDILLSRAAKAVFPFTIECKSRASSSIYGYYEQAEGGRKDGIEPLLVLKANNKRPLAIVDLEWFINRMKT